MTDYREAILKMTMMRWKNKTAPLDANTAMIVSSVASY